MSDDANNNFEALQDLFLRTYLKGKENTHREWLLKSTELQQQSMQRRILYPICWLFGHKIDPLWRFCQRCKYSEEELIRK